jgi:hypothetical protein
MIYFNLQHKYQYIDTEPVELAPDYLRLCSVDVVQISLCPRILSGAFAPQMLASSHLLLL